MYKIVIKGGKRLHGEVSVSGAKNAALPILASSLLASGQSSYRNVPGLGDVVTMRKMLGQLFTGLPLARLLMSRIQPAQVTVFPVRPFA